MLIDPQAFKILEKGLTEEGKIEKFEKESGKILGRAMITLGDIPSDLKEEVLKDNKLEDLYIFNCSFDFYDSILGVALYKENLEIASGVWATEQVDDATPPSEGWIKFFINILHEYIMESEDRFGYTIYMFVNDYSEMIITPVDPEDE